MNDSFLSILSESTATDDDMDSSFRISDGEETSSEEDEECDDVLELSALPEPDSSFIVSWSVLKSLFHFCYYETGPNTTCRAPASISKVFQKGTCIIVSLMCLSGHCSTWRSQPLVRKMALGNLRLTCATLFSGSSYSSLKEIFEYSRIAIMQRDTFYDIQKNIVRQIVHECWTRNNDLVIEKAKTAGHVKFSGDGQCDSPGHSAKYGIYSIMNQATNEIAAFRVTHCVEAGNSNRMEKFGFIKVMDELKEKNVKVEQITTDRHVQVRKHVTEQMPGVDLQFDVWHLAKNIKKELSKLSKSKPCRVLNAWIPAVSNHLFWCAASCNGDVVVLREKWASLVHHVANIHEWTGNERVHKCEHPVLGPRNDGVEKQWLKKGSPAHAALTKVVLNKKILKDLQHLTKFSHTSCLEVYHALRIKYAPKRIHYSWEGQVMRSELAIIDHNTSVDRSHAVTKDGRKRYKLTYSKATQRFTPKTIKQDKDKKTFHAMIDRAEEVKRLNIKLPVPVKPVEIPSNISKTPKPNKEEAVKMHRTRLLRS